MVVVCAYVSFKYFSLVAREVESAEVSQVKAGRFSISDHELMGVLLGAVGVGEGLVVAVAEVVGFVSVRYSLEM